jgi:hypothetical protein
VGPFVRDLVHDGPGLRSNRLRREQWIGGWHAAAQAHAARPLLGGRAVSDQAGGRRTSMCRACCLYRRMGCFQRSSAMKDPGFDTISATAQLVRAKGQHR